MSVTVRAIPTAVRRRLADGPLYYGWYIVGASFVIDIITWGTIWSFGVFFGYLVEEFSLSHANTSVSFSLQFIVTFGGAAVLGFVIDRYGAQRLLLVAVALVVAGLFGTLSINALVGLILATAAISGSIGPYLAGLTFDLFETYEPVFLAAGLISVLGGGLALAAVRLRSGNSFLTMA